MQPEHRRAVEALYREAVALADRARGWFDGSAAAWRATLDVADQALVATESLATTARLLAIIAWALDPRQAAALVPFVRRDADTPVAALLLDSTGGEIAAAARRLTARAAALTPGTDVTPPPAANLWRSA
jgi:hypothetical protein